MHETYPGNRQDAEVFKSALPRVARRLEALGGDPGDITLVFDNGNLSPEGFEAVGVTKLAFVAARGPPSTKSCSTSPSASSPRACCPTARRSSITAPPPRSTGQSGRPTWSSTRPRKRSASPSSDSSSTGNSSQLKAYFQEEGRLDPATLAGKKGRGQKWLEKAEVEKKVAGIIGGAPFKGIITCTVAPREINSHLQEALLLVRVCRHRRAEEARGNAGQIGPLHQPRRLDSGRGYLGVPGEVRQSSTRSSK